MASGQERVLRRRIRSVQSTKKITRAMELIAASRIVKAQQRVAAARPYSEQITEVIRQLAASGAGLDHPLLQPREEVKNVGFIAITADRADDEGPGADYEFEPEQTEILEHLLPRYVEARVFAAMLEAAASEQAARQRAMKAATDNAEDLIKNLSVDANKLLHAGTTTEIMEIVGGAEALRQAGHRPADTFREMVAVEDVTPLANDQEQHVCHRDRTAAERRPPQGRPGRLCRRPRRRRRL